ncbi:hypothetical protein E3P96_01526 [Wallemia ichthyophaga]|nr:hypothetical protein E3P96_01526 [Wallemia ichthyophaga]
MLILSIIAAGIIASTCQATSPFFIASTDPSIEIDGMRNAITSNDLKQISKDNLCNLDAVVVIEQPTLKEDDLDSFTSQFTFYESSHNAPQALTQPSDAAQLISSTCKSRLHKYKHGDWLARNSVIKVKGERSSLNGLSQAKRREYVDDLCMSIQRRFYEHAIVITSPSVGFDYWTTPLISSLIISFGILTPILVFAIKALLAISPTPKQPNSTLAQMPPSSLADKKNKMSMYQDDGIEGTQPTQQLTQTQRTASMPNPDEPGYWGVLMPVGRRDLNSVTFLNEKPAYRFGRHPQENDIILNGKKISNNHCKVYQTGDYDNADDGDQNASEIVVFIEDTSSNGTYINQIRCGKGVQRRLMPGDEVSFGNPLSNAPGTLDDYRYIFRPRPKKAQSIDENAGGGVFAKYEIGAQIGKGSFASVKKAYERSSGIPRAVKQITKHRFAMNQKTLKMFEREIGIIKILDHENIARFCDIFEDDQVIYLVIEFAAGGDLLDYIINRGGLSEREARDIARQMCAAMAYTHEKGITHRDLKPENILLCTKDVELPQIKITDFGLAKAVDSQTHLKTMCGTPSYLAPEVVLKRPEGYDQAVDSWSTGVIIYAMLTNSSPFDEQEDEPLHERVQKRQVDYDVLKQLGMSDSAIDFISKLLIADPETRMSLKDALNHPWINEVKVARPPPPPPIPVPNFTSKDHSNEDRNEVIKGQIEALQSELKNGNGNTNNTAGTRTPYRNGFFQDDDSSSPPKFSIPSSNHSNQNMFSSSPLPASGNRNGYSGNNGYNPKSDVSCSADMSQLQLQHLSPMLKRKHPDDGSEENYGEDSSPRGHVLRDRKQNTSQHEKNMGLKALILVGGFGTRLRPLTLTLPKPLVPFCNKPMIVHQIEALVQAGVTDIVLAVNYRPEIMEKVLKECEERYKITIHFSIESEPLGTAGPLKLAENILGKDDSPFFVLNSDVTCNYPFEQLRDFHNSHSSAGTIMVTKVDEPSNYGVVVMHTGSSQIERFVEKPKTFVGNRINAGIYIFDPKMLSRINLQPTSIETEVFPPMASDGELHAFDLQSFWADVGQPKDYIHGTCLYLSHLSNYSPNQLTQPSQHSWVNGGNVLVAPSAEIDSSALIGPNVVIGPGVKVGRGARLQRCVIMDGSRIRDHSWIHSTIVGWNCTIGRWVRIENIAVLGDDVVVKDELHINGASVLPHKSISASITEPKIVM